jgi:hypothetical protein
MARVHAGTVTIQPRPEAFRRQAAAPGETLDIIRSSGYTDGRKTEPVAISRQIAAT